MRKFTSWSQDLRVSTDGEGVVAMAGAVALRMLADRSGLTAGLSQVLTRPDFQPVHDRGRVLTDVATAIGCGASHIMDVEALRSQEQLFGAVASDTASGRALGEVGLVARADLAAARAAAREHMWNQLPNGPLALWLAGGSYSLGEQVVLRVDASIVECHSRKEQAAGTYKGGFGHQPVGVWIDNTSELASLLLRPGNAAPNNAADLVTTVDEAITQVPPPWRRRLLVTSDTAGASHEFIGWLADLDQTSNGMDVEYSVGWDVDKTVRAAIGMLHPESWTPAWTLLPANPVMTWTLPRSPPCSPTGYQPAAGRPTCRS